MNMRMYLILFYQYHNFSKYLKNPYIHYVYFVYNFKCLYPFFLLFFKFKGRRTIVFINGTLIIIMIIIMIIVIIVITEKFLLFIRGVFRAWPNIHDEAKFI